MTVGGWFDAEDLYGPLHTYAAIEEANPGISNVLVMGPWRHGGWIWTDGDSLAVADFGFKTSKTFQEEALLPFFRHHLKDEGDIDLPEAWVFETGANRWREFPAWPPEELRSERLYLHDNGALAFRTPTAEGEASDEYISDPAKPVPYTPEISTGWHSEYMAEDQRFAAWRPDVLVYRSEPLEDDLTLAGPLTAELWVSTTGGDADWVVKLIDEYPGPAAGLGEGLRGSRISAGPNRWCDRRPCAVATASATAIRSHSSPARSPRSRSNSRTCSTPSNAATGS